jgi:hypothetical protein
MAPLSMGVSLGMFPAILGMSGMGKGAGGNVHLCKGYIPMYGGTQEHPNTNVYSGALLGPLPSQNMPAVIEKQNK